MPKKNRYNPSGYRVLTKSSSIKKGMFIKNLRNNLKRLNSRRK